MKNWLVQRLHDRALRAAASRHFSGRLIDIGCGGKQYREMMADLVNEHVGLDHADSPHGTAAVDLVGSAFDIPAPDASFDCALSTAVLEHLEEPEVALRECHRVLKAGGVAIYTAPFIWHLHEEPRDFFRYSKHGLEYLFVKAGFEVLEIRALSGFWVTFGQLFVYYLYRFHRGPLRLIPVIPMFGLMIQAGALVLDRIDRAEAWTWMYLVVARRPPGAPPRGPAI